MTRRSKPVLQAQGLRLDLPGHQPVTLDLCVSQGEVVQLEGPSGCGKTTLLRMLSRLDDPAPARLTLDGEDAGGVDPWRWRRQVCYLAQRPTMLPGSVADNLRAGFGVRQAPLAPDGLDRKLDGWLEALGLDPARTRPQDSLTLSGGEAARVALARALALEPRVLLCDEPTAALDLDHARDLAALLGAWVGEGRGLLLVAHDLAPWAGLSPRKVTLGGGAS